MAVYEEEINLKDGISATALSASQKMKVLTDSINATQVALLKAQAAGNVGQMKKLTTQLDAYKSSLAQVQPEAIGLQEELAGMTGGLSIAVEAAGAAAVAFGALVVAGMSLAIEASELKAQMTTLFDALGNGQTSGAETVAMLDQLGDRIGRTRKELAPMAQQMMALGITDLPALEKAVTANASAMALMGDRGAAAFQKVLKQTQLAAEAGVKMKNPLKALSDLGLGQGQDVAAAMGISLKDLQAQIKAGTVDAKAFGDAIQDALIKKGAGPLARAGMSLTNVWAKFTENISKMFEDIDVGPFLEEVRSLFDIFGQAQPSGQAMKSAIGGFFQQTFNVAKAVVPYVKHFLLDLVIYGLKAYIALRPITRWFLDLRSNATVMLVLSKVFQGLKVAVATVAVALGVVVAVFAAVVAASALVATGIWSLIGSIVAVGASIAETLSGLVEGAINWGRDFIAGLVGGIKNGASAVIDAVSNLATSAKDAFKNVLGIHSPSRVMMQMGSFAGQGVADGLTAAVPDVHGAASSLGSVAASGVASGAGSGGAGGSSGASVNVTVEAGAIVIQGAGKGAEELTEEAVALLFERVALAQGL